MYNRNTPWVKHCKKCGKFVTKQGRHPDGKCERKYVPVKKSDPNRFQLEAHKIANLVTEKQLAYGDSFGKAGDIMRTLYPDGIRPDQMKDALTVVRVIDKLFRIATKKDAFGESPWKDVMGYALLAHVREVKK